MKTEKARVTVSFGEGDSKKEFGEDYTYPVYENSDDVLNGLQVKANLEQLLKDLNSGIKSRLYLLTRSVILERQAGPERSFNKMVDELVKNRAALGRPITRDQAVKMIQIVQGLDAENGSAETGQAA